MSKPEPRRDEKNVPWCTGICRSYRDKRFTIPARCMISDKVMDISKERQICLPQVEIDEAGLVEAESEIASLYAAAKRLQATLDQWPRVYWNSSPKSIEEGYRVLSVSGCEGCDCEESWFDVYVDDPEHDGDCAAPADGGLYSSSEDAIAAREQKT